MIIDVECVSKGCKARLMDGAGILFESQWHPRPGCATREAMIFMQATLGTPNVQVRLEVLEWK